MIVFRVRIRDRVSEFFLRWRSMTVVRNIQWGNTEVTCPTHSRAIHTAAVWSEDDDWRETWHLNTKMQMKLWLYTYWTWNIQDNCIFMWALGLYTVAAMCAGIWPMYAQHILTFHWVWLSEHTSGPWVTSSSIRPYTTSNMCVPLVK